jgi:16S rRNA (guanine966-N2)-methyltransferase
VTRIIAGVAGSTAIEVPAAGTRPTSDRVRESLFGALDAAGLVAGARVADLYAGSGALGLEAVSRGAASADLVEQAPRAATVVQRNADRVRRAGVAAPVRVHRAAVQTFLDAPSTHGPWDLVLVDPPYDLPDRELTAVLTALRAHLHGDAVVVIERAKRSPGPDWASAGLEAWRDRSYGDTTLWWGQPLPADASR